MLLSFLISEEATSAGIELGPMRAAIDSVLAFPSGSSGSAEVLNNKLKSALDAVKVQGGVQWLFLHNHTALLRIVYDEENTCYSIAAYDIHYPREYAGEDAIAVSLPSDPIPLFASVLMPRTEIKALPVQLLSAAVLIQVVDMLLNPLDAAKPTVIKNGTDLVESRELPLPIVVHEWLLAFLSLEKKPSPPSTVHPFRKKLRCEAIFESGEPFRRSVQYNALRVLLQTTLVDQHDRDLAKGTRTYKFLFVLFNAWLMNQAATLRPDLLHTGMLTKIAIRIKKLEQPVTPFETAVAERCKQHVVGAQVMLSARWKDAQELHATSTKIDLGAFVGLDVASALVHPLSNDALTTINIALQRNPAVEGTPFVIASPDASIATSLFHEQPEPSSISVSVIGELNKELERRAKSDPTSKNPRVAWSVETSLLYTEHFVQEVVWAHLGIGTGTKVPVPK